MLQKSKTEEIAVLRKISLISITITTFSIATSLLILPILFNHAQNIQSSLDHELHFCKKRSIDLWETLYQVESAYQ